MGVLKGVAVSGSAAAAATAEAAAATAEAAASGATTRVQTAVRASLLR